MQVRHFIFIFVTCALVSIVAYGVWLATGSAGATAHANLVTRSASKAEEKLLMAAQPKPHPCPQSQGQTLQPSQLTGHHKVTLTWNASAPASDPRNQGVGYCLYRSGLPNVAASDPKCNKCEQVNQYPIVGTACVDDLVQDSVTYYYVAMAINGNGDTSSLSNDTLAQIPPATKSPVAEPAYPRCRAGNGSQ